MQTNKSHTTSKTTKQSIKHTRILSVNVNNNDKKEYSSSKKEVQILSRQLKVPFLPSQELPSDFLSFLPFLFSHFLKFYPNLNSIKIFDFLKWVSTTRFHRNQPIFHQNLPIYHFRLLLDLRCCRNLPIHYQVQKYRTKSFFSHFSSLTVLSSDLSSRTSPTANDLNQQSWFRLYSLPVQGQIPFAPIAWASVFFSQVPSTLIFCKIHPQNRNNSNTTLIWTTKQNKYSNIKQY